MNGHFWTSFEADAAVVTAGVSAPADGLFCPDALPENSHCALVEKDAVAPGAGVFIAPTDANGLNGEVKAGDAAPVFGYFCGGCGFADTGAVAPSSGEFFTCTTCNAMASRCTKSARFQRLY